MTRTRLGSFDARRPKKDSEAESRSKRSIGFRVGDRLDPGHGVAYRLTEDLAAPQRWSAFSELSGVWIEKDKADGVANENSGGTTVYLSGGLRDRIGERFAISLAPAVALLQDVNGEQVESDWKLALTLTRTL